VKTVKILKNWKMNNVQLIGILSGILLVISACSSLEKQNNLRADPSLTSTPTEAPTVTPPPTETLSPSPTNTPIPTMTPTLIPSQEPVISATVEDIPVIDSNTICNGRGDTVIYLVTGKRNEKIYLSWIDSELTYWQEIRRVPFCYRLSDFPDEANMFVEASYKSRNEGSEIKCQIFYLGEKVAEDIVSAEHAGEDRKATCLAVAE
jgi:hypothetical protein